MDPPLKSGRYLQVERRDPLATANGFFGPFGLLTLKLAPLYSG